VCTTDAARQGLDLGKSLGFAVGLQKPSGIPFSQRLGISDTPESANVLDYRAGQPASDAIAADDAFVEWNRKAEREAERRRRRSR
jgi:hypothetical protein